MAERVFINDLNPITDIQDGAKILVDQNGYKKMFYEDFVIDIADTLKSEHDTGWNADLIGGTNVSVESPQQGDVLIFNSSSNEFENRRIDSNDIDWSSISVNEYKFLQVGSGGIVEQDFVSIPSLRIDNDTSGGYFLRVKSGNRQIEAVQFDPNEFTINAQTLEGNTVSDLDGRYLRVVNNLQDITDASVARNSLNVISESESDSRYLSRVGNLSDVNNAATSFNNIKQPATTSFAGVIEIATSPEVQDGLRSDVAVVPSTLSDNYYNKAISDARFLNAANNLDDLNNSTAARQNLNVYSSTETDGRYLQKALNLSDIGSRQLARDNLEVYDRNYIDTFTLNPVNNLSDVDNVSQARLNLNIYDRPYIDSLENSLENQINAVENDIYKPLAMGRSTGTNNTIYASYNCYASRIGTGRTRIYFYSNPYGTSYVPVVHANTGSGLESVVVTDITSSYFEVRTYGVVYSYDDGEVSGSSGAYRNYSFNFIVLH